jgi:hypothetical protein
LRQEKRLKRWMKELLAARGLNVDNWRYLQSTPEKLVIIHKHSLQPREVEVMNTTSQFTRITNP